MIKTKKILVIEDNDHQRELLKKYMTLMDQDYEIFEAKTDQLALELALQERFDLFVMDINLESELNGFEVALKLREMPKYVLTWILFLTVEKEFELRAYREVRCHAFLDKPYPKDEFQKMIKQLLNNPLTPSPIEESKYLIIESDHVVIRIQLDEVIFVEAKGRGVVIYTARGNYELSYKSLKMIVEELKAYSEFLKVHRSFLINVHYVKSIHKMGIKQFEIEFYGCKYKSLLSKNQKDSLEALIRHRG